MATRISNDGTRGDTVLIKDATTATSITYDVKRTRNIIVYVYGTATTAVVNFYSVYPSGDLVPKQGIVDETYSMTSSVSPKAAVRFDVSGLDGLKVEVTKPSGGTGTVSVLIREVE